MARFLSISSILAHRQQAARRTIHFGAERGQVLMLSALLLPILIASAGMAIDVGRVSAVRTNAQSAADAAAHAGALSLKNGDRMETARAQALSLAAKNGFSSTETKVNIPPTAGAHRGDRHYVEVIVSRDEPTAFMRVLGIETVATGARAVARWSSRKNYGLVVLNETKCGAYSQSGTSSVAVNGGGVMVNSSCKPSGQQMGAGNLTAEFIDYFEQGAWSGNATSVKPTAVEERIRDPYAGLTRPAPGGASPDSGGTAAGPALRTVSGTVTLRPGTYYGGLRIGGAGTVTFQPGTYVFASGGFRFEGAGKIVGSEVTFFNTGDPAASNSRDRACASMSFAGSGAFELTAPASGTYENMLLWQDDTCSAPLELHGNGAKTAGIIYLPKAPIDTSGGGTIGAVQVIADSYQHSGNYALTIDAADLAPLGRVSLVE